jgi:MoaA/NifB/PqqE/SkfB family radical SAM enzyme
MLQAAVAKWRWRRGFAPYPRGMDFLLTDACDLHCTYCARKPAAGSGGARPAFMDTASMLDLVDHVAEFKPWIRLIGGEPFLHEDWSRLVRRAGQHGMWCASVTNGLRAADLASELVASGLRVLGVSVDGPEAIHDTARGSGTFQRIREGLAEVRRCKARQGSDLPLIEIYLTVHPANQGELVRFAEELSTWGIWKLRLQQLLWATSAQLCESVERIQAAIPGARFFGPELGPIRDRPSGVDACVLAEQIARLKGSPYPFAVEIHPDLPVDELDAYHNDPGYRRPSDRPCHCMEGYSYVDPLGRVHPCVTLDVGNAFQEPFARIWNGRKYRAFRRLIRRAGRLPFCQRCPD